ncbi:hypothetical protein ACXM5X_31700 [Pseudomonas saponiphila]
MSLNQEQIDFVTNKTKSAALEYNSIQKYQEDDKTYIQVFGERKDEFLAKADIKNPSPIDLYKIEAEIVNKEIKDILENNPELSRLNKLVDLGAVSLNVDQKDYPSLEFYNERIENGMYTLMSVEPLKVGDELSKGIKIHSWGEDELFPAKDIKSGLLDAQKIAQSVVVELKEKEDLLNTTANKNRIKPKM